MIYLIIGYLIVGSVLTELTIYKHKIECCWITKFIFAVYWYPIYVVAALNCVYELLTIGYNKIDCR